MRSQHPRRPFLPKNARHRETRSPIGNHIFQIVEILLSYCFDRYIIRRNDSVAATRAHKKTGEGHGHHKKVIRERCCRDAGTGLCGLGRLTAPSPGRCSGQDVHVRHRRRPGQHDQRRHHDRPLGLHGREGPLLAPVDVQRGRRELLPRRVLRRLRRCPHRDGTPARKRYLVGRRALHRRRRRLHLQHHRQRTFRLGLRQPQLRRAGCG